jgi:hypothetical protein
VQKTKALRANTSKTDPFSLRGESIEDLDSLIYLGSIVAKDGGVAQDVSQRIRRADCTTLPSVEKQQNIY